LSLEIQDLNEFSAYFLKPATGRTGRISAYAARARRLLPGVV